ncbi:MAG TPA: hypothetical protein VLF60_00970 [Candidatus Saccharimonadales bacterium]|nr:hypothetical protein [Candidatus Saccharimonadales bacterium]
MKTGMGEQRYWQQPEDDKDTMAGGEPSPQIGFSALPPIPNASPESNTPPSDPEGPAPASHDQEEPLVSWEAAEFIQHAKGTGWFVALGVFAVVILAIGIFVLKDWFATAGFVVMLVAIAVVAGRPPRVLKYALDESGVHIGDKFYDYEEFQSFGVLQEATLWSVILMPSARFKPAVTIYFEQAKGEEIVDILGQFLPMEKHQPDLVDRLATKIRF